MNKATRSRLMTWWASEHAQRVTRRIAAAKATFTRQGKRIQCFLELDDPYSYLLSRYLPALESSFDVTIEYHLVESLGGGYRPCPGMQAEYALVDCERVARELGIPFLDKGAAPPVEHRRAILEYLADREGDGAFDAELLQVLAYYWCGDAASVARRAEGMQARQGAVAMLERNARRLEKLGHYCGGTLRFGGEWYAGVDRLGYLVRRLTDSGLAKSDTPDRELVALQRVLRPDLPVAPPNAARALPPLDLFFSFRSPYSYIGLRSLLAVADAFNLDVKLRPVLPMVMRGMQVPRNKAGYFMRDAGREARRHGLSMARIDDPLGAGVERCHAVCAYAGSQRRGRDFVIAATAAIWERGLDVGTDAGMRAVSDAAGLFWPDVVEAMKDDSWRGVAEANRRSMTESGLWGVPTVRMGDFVAWGQDRDWLLARHVEELCDTGEGILI